MEKETFPEGNVNVESSYSPEVINHKIEELLLSCDRAGEGGKAVVLKIATHKVSRDLDPALEALKISADSTDKAIKLFKLYLSNKGAWEYEMHQRAQRALADIPEEQRGDFAFVPALSSKQEITLEEDARRQLEKKFSVSLAGGKSQLIAMEYIDGEDLATIFYKWILERENKISPEESDAMTFNQLYEEVSSCLHFETLPQEKIDDPRVLELAEWKNSATNTAKLYDYLKKHRFPFPPRAVAQIENTLNQLHKRNIMHGDAFERNVMITGGMRALRSKNSLAGEQSYIIDFGEAKDHMVEGVDELAVVRRLKDLLVSPEEKTKAAEARRFQDLDTKAKLLQEQNKRWRDIYGKVEVLSRSDPLKGLALAWNNTAALEQNWIEDFFVVAKNLIQAGISTKEEVVSFVADKKRKATPYGALLIGECLQWINSM